jgi:hypothetical protein
MLADFHGGQSHPAGGTQNQQCLARLQAGAVVQRQMRGPVSNLKGCGLNVAHAVGNRHATRCRQAHKPGKSAAARYGGNPRARQYPGHARATGHHGSGNFHAKRERQRGVSW